MGTKNEGTPRFHISRRDYLKLHCLIPAIIFPLPRPPIEATPAPILPDRLKPGELFDGRPISRVDTKKPYVAITVDDGYDLTQVERFLRIAEIFKTKFTVFPVGTVMTAEPDLWRQVYEAEHEIGNHSHSHIDVRDQTKRAIMRDFERFEYEDYPDVIGLPFPDPGLARVPFAQGPVNRDVQAVTRELRDLHVHWRLDSYSWKKGGRDSKANLEYVLARMADVKAGDIIILHFVPLDMAALPWILDLLSKKGLENVTFTKLWRTRKQIMKRK